MNGAESYLTHTTSFEELGWGIVLIAVTMTIHAFGMVLTQGAGDAMQKRMLGGFVGMAGLLTFAWSTTVLLRIAQDFEKRQLQHIARRRQSGDRSVGGPP
jgi:hypothetical protein